MPEPTAEERAETKSWEVQERGGNGPEAREPSGVPHAFNRPPSQQAHGYGHPATARSGHLRNSGHAGAHRIGGKR